MIYTVLKKTQLKNIFIYYLRPEILNLPALNDRFKILINRKTAAEFNHFFGGFLDGVFGIVFS